MSDQEYIQLAHGGGGELSAELVKEVILPALHKASTQSAAALTDAAAVELTAGRHAFTTDSYVVKPLEFPGGDMGKLSVCGTVNDLAVAGAAAKFISLSLVLEEGLPMALLKRLLKSAAEAAREAGAAIVTGDTKVVERGACDGAIMNTAGIGEILPQARLGFDSIAAGDKLLLSGALAEHGMAVMSVREGLSFSASLASDCGSIGEPALALVRELGGEVRFMRDPTRGGLAATLAEISAATGRDMEIEESRIPVNRTARAVAEMLGLDMLSAANEGKFVAVVAAGSADRARRIMSNYEISREAAVIGTIGEVDSAGGIVEMTTTFGGRRVVQMPYGEELPRIC